MSTWENAAARGGPAGVDIIARLMAQPERKDAWGGFATGWAVTGTLLAGILVWGGIGFLVDRLAGTDPVFLAIGMIVGAAGGIYLVYVRYGKEDRDG